LISPSWHQKAALKMSAAFAILWLEAALMRDNNPETFGVPGTDSHVRGGSRPGEIDRLFSFEGNFCRRADWY
jgi:hypothetical protein